MKIIIVVNLFTEHLKWKEQDFEKKIRSMQIKVYRLLSILNMLSLAICYPRWIDFTIGNEAVKWAWSWQNTIVCARNYIFLRNECYCDNLLPYSLLRLWQTTISTWENYISMYTMTYIVWKLTHRSDNQTVLWKKNLGLMVRLKFIMGLKTFWTTKNNWRSSQGSASSQHVFMITNKSHRI